MRPIILIILITSFTSSAQNFSTEIVGTWNNKSASEENVMIFSSDASYKMMTKKSNKIVFPIKIGKWTISSDTLKLTNMDALDKEGKSIYFDSSVSYFRDIAMRIYLGTDSLVFYERVNNIEKKKIFKREIKK